MTQPTTQKSGFFSGLKNLIVETTPEAVAEASAPTAPPSAWVSKSPPVSGWAKPTAIDPEVRKLLETDINEAAKPAYSEFVAAAESMASVIPDERQRFQAALAALAPRKLTLQAILTDVDECLAALDKKEQENSIASTKAREQKVGTREARVTQLNNQIDGLRNQITAFELDRDRIQGEIATETQHITEIDAKFSATVSAYRAELLDRKTKIQNLVGK